MSDNLMEELSEPAQRKKKEFENLMRLLNEEVERRNADRGESQKFVFQGAYIIQLGHLALHLKFDQRYDSPANFDLVLSVGAAPFRQHRLFGTGPQPVKHILQPAIFDDLGIVVWKHNIDTLQPFTSAALVYFCLELLVGQYDKYKPK